ncbi:hypothetical protein AB0J48_35350 [Nocardia salmonicida]|uniref:hypothetical protein n=1 Tax=Nocardia salmonicida TaxID=53431 RepID=UPI00342E40FE
MSVLVAPHTPVPIGALAAEVAESEFDSSTFVGPALVTQTESTPIAPDSEPEVEPVPEPGTAAFLDAISAIGLTFERDRRAAKRAFRGALDLATDADWDVLDYMVEVFTLYPRESALRRLRARWAAGDDLERERLVRLVPDTDPVLHSHADHDLAQILEARAKANPDPETTAADEFAKLHVQLLAAEMPRQTIRMWRNPLPRLTMPASRAVDASRLRPEQIRARVSARGKRRPAEAEPFEVTDYVAESLFVDTEVDNQARMRQRMAELIARGVRFTGTTPGWTPRRPGERAPLPTEVSEAIWDHQYCAFVADQHDLDRAEAGAPVKSHEHSLLWAEQRTGLGSRSDRRDSYLFQGNGLDDFRTAMNPVAGWRCVSCFVERAATDQRPTHTRAGVLRSDDGLCDYCRSDNRTGLPALEAGFELSELATTYCTYLAEHYPDAACALLAEVRRRAPEWLIRVIDGFLATHPDLPGTPTLADIDDEPAPARVQPVSRRRARALPPGQRAGRCEGCTQYLPVHDDGFCTKCRVHLGLYVPATRDNTAA